MAMSTRAGLSTTTCAGTRTWSRVARARNLPIRTRCRPKLGTCALGRRAHGRRELHRAQEQKATTPLRALIAAVRAVGVFGWAGPTRPPPPPMDDQAKAVAE